MRVASIVVAGLHISDNLGLQIYFGIDSSPPATTIRVRMTEVPIHALRSCLAEFSKLFGVNPASQTFTHWEQMPLPQTVKETIEPPQRAPGEPRRGMALRPQDGLSAAASLRHHWPEYLMEVCELGFYMVATCLVATLLQYPASPVHHLVSSELARRALMGVTMGATMIALILSPWGKQSGGHFNPAVTFAFYRLGKVEFWDWWFYAAAQFVGAILGVCIAKYALLGTLRNDAAQYAVTEPGIYGQVVAFAAELVISFVLMSIVLYVTNRANLARYTPYFVGAMIAIYITFEAPLSGISTNPARTFAPALHAGDWHALWIYFLAPTLGMLAAADVFLRVRGGVPPYCAKLHHDNDKRCIFHH